MSLNFCSHVLLPRIRSSAVSVDGYEVSNLTSPHLAHNNKGFMVESFIKPPLSITIEFPVNIAISEVVIASCVGSQRSCAFELYSYSQNKRTQTWLFGNESGSHTNLESHSIPFDTDTGRIYSLLGRSQDQQAQYFSFKNSYFKLNEQYRSATNMTRRTIFSNGTSVKQTELRAKKPYHLNNVSTLVIRITRAAHGCTCAVKWIEVWGDPARTCPKPWVEHLLKLHSDTLGISNRFTPTQENSASQSLNSAEREKERLAVSTELPEEFLDPLTQHMMMMPVLLPCGKSIDQSSLDKHIQEASKWGHSPSDPFTGRTFNSSFKPVPNASLKARIDQFLLRNPELAKLHDFRVGRNIPRLTSEQTVTNSVLVPNHSDENIRSTSTSNITSLCRKRRMEQVHDSYLCGPAKKCSRNTDSTSFPSASSTESFTSLNGKSPDATVNLVTTSANTSSLSSDLDSALKNTLAGLPSFLNRPSVAVNDEVDRTSKGTTCSQCSKDVDIGQLYKLQCDHLLCRNCLTNVKLPAEMTTGSDVWCSICKRSMKRSTVVKAHV